MKRKAKNFLVAFLTTFCIIACLSFVLCGINIAYCDFQSEASVAEAKDLYSFLTPQIIELYEKEVAHAPIFSALKEERIERLEERLHASRQKLAALILLHDLLSRADMDRSLDELAAMKDLALLSLAKTAGDKYLNSLESEERDRLKKLFFSKFKLF